MLGRHHTLDEMIAKIEEVTMDDVNAVLDLMFAEPFALAMVGASDRTIAGLRRDDFVALRSNSKVTGQ
jgi:predicted Zn-dependent peptidase